MRAKVYLLFATLITIAFVLSACGSSTTPESQIVEVTRIVEGESITETIVVTATPEPAGPVTLSLWSAFSETEPIAVILAENIAAWNTANPDIQVEVSWLGRESITKLRTALLGGDTPDIISHSDSELYPSVVANGLAYQLDDALNTPGYQTSESWRDTFIALAPYSGNGSYYLIPQSYYTSGFFYNVSIFEKYDIEVPETWSEFLDVAETLKENGVTPLGVNGAYSFFPSWYFSWLASRIAGDAEFRAAAQDPTGAAWEDPAFLEAAKQVQYLVDQGYFQAGYEGTTWPGAEELFAGGNVGMYLTGTWFPAEISDKVGEDWRMEVFAFPKVEGGKGDQTAAEAWSNSWLILKDSPNVDASIAFLKFMSSKEAQSGLSKIWIPAAVKGVPLPKYTEGQQAILENANSIYPRLHGLQDDNPEWVVKVFWVLDDSLVYGQIDAEEFISSLVAEQASFFSK